MFADLWVLDALDAPADEAGTAFVVLDAAPFLQVGSRRLLSWLAVRAAPPVDAKAQLPSEVPRPPSNTVSERIDLNHTSVRDFGRHGCDLDRVCKDIREDFCGEHGLAEIDRRIHSAQAVWSGGVLQLWLCWRTARELPHRGGLPRRLAAQAAVAQPPADSACNRPPADSACNRPPAVLSERRARRGLASKDETV